MDGCACATAGRTSGGGGALYAAGKTGYGKVNVHFTRSAEHRRAFLKPVEEKVSCPFMQKKYGVEYTVSVAWEQTVEYMDTVLPIWRTNLSPIKASCCSVQSSALIENFLNDLDADVTLYQEYIDNVV